MSDSLKILGIDTSNYTTSVAIVDEGGYSHRREILSVGAGERGLRQSDALFLHTKNLPRLMSELGAAHIDGVAYSSRPRAVEGSYMPCFLAGESVAVSIASLLGVPCFAFSHQAGHIEAALRTCGADIKGEMLAFHLSGGTTEILHVTPNEKEGYICDIIGNTLDISAGQLVDRVGVMLGLGFPCGGELEKLAEKNSGKLPPRKISVPNGSCNLSGFENKIGDMISRGEDPSLVARYTLDVVSRTVIEMTRSAREKYPSLPVIYAGGVMRNAIIRNDLVNAFDNIYFAKTELSSDNAVGTAYLGYRRMKGAENG